MTGNEIEEILARCDYYLENNQLNEALNELNHGIKEDDFTNILISDWKKLAKERLIVDQSMKILKAELALKHSTFF